jgi:hypothetical protein
LIDHLAQNEIYDAANVDLSVIVMIIASLFVVMREMQRKIFSKLVMPAQVVPLAAFNEVIRVLE